MDKIQKHFDQQLHAFIVILPEYVTLTAPENWGQEFLQAAKREPARVGLLLDSNVREFESAACLKWLRDFFAGSGLIGTKITRVAFVQPEQYKKPEIVSDVEAYFANVQDARSWLWLF